MTVRTLGAFCGARDGRRPVFRDAARELGAAMAKRGLHLVYGGGANGMMGALADAVLEGGGHVTGVIPHGLARAEFAHDRLSALHLVDTMHERKAMMEKLADGFVALPGGYGTLDELFEIATWSQIGLHDKPIALLDTEGYWQGLKAQVLRAIDEGFISQDLDQMLVIESDPKRLLDRLLKHAPPPPVVAWQKR